MPKSNWKEAWWIRKVIYAALALALTIAVGGGWISDTQADTWLTQADKIISILAAVGLGIAATKTHRGSDDRTTVRDVAMAAGRDPRLSDIGMIVNDIRDAVAALTPHGATVGVQPRDPGDYTKLTR
ncbi:MAG: hypothetical protein SPK00_10380 [Corynebacterium glucuronolyticum]|nr:hypothetical protein [Mycobacteriaceae bacterium]MDY5835131.1 hypothetical protein [Corynebacterium glucuronolyticum]